MKKKYDLSNATLALINDIKERNATSLSVKASDKHLTTVCVSNQELATTKTYIGIFNKANQEIYCLTVADIMKYSVNKGEYNVIDVNTAYTHAKSILR